MSTTTNRDDLVAGWSYELAMHFDGQQYFAWEPRISFDRPCVPDGSIRNLTALVTTPAPQGEDAIDAARYRRVRRCMWPDDEDDDKFTLYLRLPHHNDSVAGFLDDAVDAAIAGAAPPSPPSVSPDVQELVESVGALLEAQDALDNREISGPNAEDYFTLLRRRNSARDGMDAALSKYGSKQ